MTQNTSFRKLKSETKLASASKAKIRKSQDKLFDRLAQPVPSTEKYDRILEEAKQRHKKLDIREEEVDKQIRNQNRYEVISMSKL